MMFPSPAVTRSPQPLEERRARDHERRVSRQRRRLERSGPPVAHLGHGREGRRRDREGDAAHDRQVLRRRARLVARRLEDLLHVDARRRAVFLPERFGSVFRSRQPAARSTKVASINGSIGGPRPSPDGKWIAFNGTLYGTAERSYDQPDLFVAAADGTGAPRNLTDKYDFDIGGGVGGDQRAPRGGGAGGAIWSADGKSIIIVAGEQGDRRI